MTSPTTGSTWHINGQENSTRESYFEKAEQHTQDNEGYTNQESQHLINPEALTPDEQQEYFQQLRRIQLAQIGQIHHAYHLCHENVQQQAASVLKAHEEFQQMMQDILFARSNPINISMESCVLYEDHEVLHNLASDALMVTPPSEIAVPSKVAPMITAVSPVTISSENLSCREFSNSRDVEMEQQGNIVKPTHRFSVAYIMNEEFVPAMLATREQIEDEVHNNSSEHNTFVQQWKQSVREWEISSEKMKRDEKHRLIFERSFPELRKVRTKKERSSKDKRKVSAPSGFLAIAQRDEEKKLLNVAPIPSFSPKVAAYDDTCFDQDRNFRNALDDNKTMIDSARSQWSDKEYEIFLNKYKEVGKNLSFIAEFLPDKSVSDCVLFYYLNKSQFKFKSIHRKKRKAAKTYKSLPMPTVEEVDKFQLNNTQVENDNGSNLNALEILSRAIEKMNQM